MTERQKRRRSCDRSLRGRAFRVHLIEQGARVRRDDDHRDERDDAEQGEVGGFGQHSKHAAQRVGERIGERDADAEAAHAEADAANAHDDVRKPCSHGDERCAADEHGRQLSAHAHDHCDRPYDHRGCRRHEKPAACERARVPVRRERKRREGEAADDGAGFARLQIHMVEQGKRAVVQQPVADKRSHERKRACKKTRRMGRRGRVVRPCPRSRSARYDERGGHDADIPSPDRIVR